MLTADLVRARRRGDTLSLLKLEGSTREAALGFARRYLGVAQACVGEPRESFDLACRGVAVSAKHRRLAAGLLKLVSDRCEFEAEPGLEPQALRQEVFTRAAAARREGTFDRGALLAEVAAEHELDGSPLDGSQLERLLYADLRGAHLMSAFSPISAEGLLEAYLDGQAQAVLLRASRVVVVLECRAAPTFRRIFHRLKFLRLLFGAERLGGGRYRIEIDGPFSLFSAVTRYGLQLALTLPVLREADAFELEATVHWGKDRQPLRFLLAETSAAEGRGKRRSPRALPDEVATLIARFETRRTPWRAAPCAEILNLPGVGLCVPDLVFRREDRPPVYLEVLGYWSRAAVWKRVELVEAGLDQRILFCVSSRLRVSEAALDDELPGALYVYKGALAAAVVEAKLDELAGR